MPIYIINGKRLVKANTAAQAVRFVARKEITCKVASTEEALLLGVKLEDATAAEIEGQEPEGVEGARDPGSATGLRAA